MVKTISLAYSPDTDDAFMVEALRTNIVRAANIKFSFIKDDIQALNEKARQVKYDITAISMATYPFVAKDYILLDSGASVGSGFGPRLVCHPQNSREFLNLSKLRNKRIAIPGLQTTAYFAAWHLFGPFEPVPLNFEYVADAVITGQVDAGLLIHELQLKPEDQGLSSIGDLGALWHERYQLPLPLGGNAIRRTLGAELVGQLSQLYRDSIAWGLAHRDETLKNAVAACKPELDLAAADRYISMYVNDETLKLGRDAQKAVRLLFEVSAQSGLCPPLEGDPFLFLPRV